MIIEALKLKIILQSKQILRTSVRVLIFHRMISYLRKSPICIGCKKFLGENTNGGLQANEVASLKDCSKCKFAKYCSVKCQKKDWKDHKMHCETLSEMSDHLKKLEEDHPGIGENKDITDQEVEQVLEERSIFYVTKSDDRNHREFLEKYENDNRCQYLYTRLVRARMYWYHAEVNNAYFLYERYYHYIKDLIKCCPVLMDNLVYYFIMSLIILDLWIKTLRPL